MITRAHREENPFDIDANRIAELQERDGALPLYISRAIAILAADE